MKWIGHRIIRNALAELADAEYQRQLWTGALEDQMGSLVEAHCALFDDSALGKELDLGRPVFGEPVDAALVDLGVLLRKIDDRRSPADILADPRLEEVRALAASILFEIVRRTDGIYDIEEAETESDKGDD